ncbi:MAG: hypothetical protein K5924_09060 [Chloroflexi bacterium]|nr:hypothetical protein [Chloroflexota bacterium]
MELFVAFKYLHIAAMFFAVALALSGEIVLRAVANSGEVVAIRTTAERVRPLANLSTILFLVGVAFGVIAALAGQINLLATWLILAYVAFLAAMAIGITITDPWVGRLERAAAESPADAPSDALREVIADPRARAATWALMALVAIIVFVMVVKPLS